LCGVQIRFVFKDGVSFSLPFFFPREIGNQLLCKENQEKNVGVKNQKEIKKDKKRHKIELVGG
jgi:hypothetical protein